MLRHSLFAGLFCLTSIGSLAFGSPKNLVGNTGVYYDQDLHGNYILSDPTSAPGQRWAVFYGPQPGKKTAYIEVVHESRAYQGDFEKQTGAIEKKTVTIGTVTNYQNGIGKVKVGYIRTYVYDYKRKVLSDTQAKAKEYKTYTLSVPDTEHFSLTLPDGTTQNYVYEAGDIGGYDEDMKAYLKRKR